MILGAKAGDDLAITAYQKLGEILLYSFGAQNPWRLPLELYK